MSVFRFPRCIFADSNIVSIQLKHAVSEMDEAYEAMWSESMQRTAEEIVDCIHSLETALRIIQEKHGITLVDVFRQVENKNRQRGYY